MFGYTPNETYKMENEIRELQQKGWFSANNEVNLSLITVLLSYKEPIDAVIKGIRV